MNKTPTDSAPNPSRNHVSIQLLWIQSTLQLSWLQERLCWLIVEDRIILKTFGWAVLVKAAQQFIMELCVPYEVAWSLASQLFTFTMLLCIPGPSREVSIHCI